MTMSAEEEVIEGLDKPECKDSPIPLDDRICLARVYKRKDGEIEVEYLEKLLPIVVDAMATGLKLVLNKLLSKIKPVENHSKIIPVQGNSMFNFLRGKKK